MIVFAKDLGSIEGESKYDMLAVSVARTIGITTKFAHPNYNADLAVSQIGDGLARIAHGRKQVCIFHDWFDAYEKYLVEPFSKIIFLGKFAHPAIDNSVTLASYPVSPVISSKMDDDYPVLICGEYTSRCYDWILKTVDFIGIDRVRVACYNEMYYNYADADTDYGILIDGIKNKGVSVDLRPKVPISLLFDYMASAYSIVHCGGNRGLVHSMAVSTNRCMSYTGDDTYRPSAINELNARLLSYCR